MTGRPQPAQDQRSIVEQWLDGESGDHEIDDEGTELRDFFNTTPEAREDLEHRIARLRADLDQCRRERDGLKQLAVDMASAHCLWGCHHPQRLAALDPEPGEIS